MTARTQMMVPLVSCSPGRESTLMPHRSCTRDRAYELLWLLGPRDHPAARAMMMPLVSCSPGREPLYLCREGHARVTAQARSCGLLRPRDPMAVRTQPQRTCTRDRAYALLWLHGPRDHLGRTYADDAAGTLLAWSRARIHAARIMCACHGDLKIEAA